MLEYMIVLMICQVAIRLTGCCADLMCDSLCLSMLSSIFRDIVLCFCIFLASSPLRIEWNFYLESSRFGVMFLGASLHWLGNGDQPKQREFRRGGYVSWVI